MVFRVFPHPSPTGFVLESGGPGRLEMVGMGIGLSRGPRGDEPRPPTGLGGSFISRWCPSLHHGAGQEPGVQLLTAICCRCVTSGGLHVLTHL